MNTKTLLYAVVCAWCPDGKAMTIEFLSRDVPVTHGMCEDCRAKIERELDARETKTPKEPDVVSLDDPNVPESLVPKP